MLSIVRKMESKRKTIKSALNNKQPEREHARTSLFVFMSQIVEKQRKNGKIRTSETYQSTINSLRKFRAGKDIRIDELTVELVESYEAYLQSKGLVPNTTSFYMRIVRAVCKKACEMGMVKTNMNLFSHVYTGVDKTNKRAVNVAVIKQIKALDLKQYPRADFARDMFMMCFYMRGMSIIDLAFLKKTDLILGVLTYRRRKTGRQLVIKWTKEMQEIVDKYPANKTEYMLPIIVNRQPNNRDQYLSQYYKINRGLRFVAEKLGLQQPLTTYVSRHAWASIAREKGIPISIISEGLGHDSEQTTRIYLASLDASLVDEANDSILSLL